MIEDGSTVELEFSLKLEDGTLVQSNAGQEPLRYVQGKGTLLKALEDAVAGKAADEDVSIRPSRKGKFISVTVTFTAESREQLDSIYRTLTASERILFVL